MITTTQEKSENQPVGSFPIREDITVLPADDPRKVRLGWVIREEIGICAFNDYALSRVDLGTEDKIMSENEIYEREL